MLEGAWLASKGFGRCMVFCSCLCIKARSVAVCFSSAERRLVKYVNYLRERNRGKEWRGERGKGRRKGEREVE